MKAKEYFVPPLTKAELAEKYQWEERHADECECVYCVMMEMFSLKYEKRGIKPRRSECQEAPN